MALEQNSELFLGTLLEDFKSAVDVYIEAAATKHIVSLIGGINAEHQKKGRARALFKLCITAETSLLSKCNSTLTSSAKVLNAVSADELMEQAAEKVHMTDNEMLWKQRLLHVMRRSALLLQPCRSGGA
eukprot:NODE_18994_length_865_cov_1.655827.p1 GENE.NODE_18994_length_865_cov_1.655827~~NODE_18994_length_865_cov_1.655827.p1  ORF type:complete len:129 (+),score=18.99 NODE_18994_length_865_cov_1.655827:295-681(+)